MEKNKNTRKIVLILAIIFFIIVDLIIFFEISKSNDFNHIIYFGIFNSLLLILIFIIWIIYLFRYKKEWLGFKNLNLKDFSKLSESYHMDLLKIQANKRGGTIKPDVGEYKKYVPVPATAQVIFPYNKINVNVTTCKGKGGGDFGEPPRTTVSINLQLNQNIKFIVYFKDMVLFSVMPEYKGWIFGVKKVKSNDTILNKEFVIKTNDEYFAFNLLNSEMRKRLLELSSDKLNPILKITKNNLSLTAGSILSEEKEYDKLIETAILFFNRLHALKYVIN